MLTLVAPQKFHKLHIGTYLNGFGYLELNLGLFEKQAIDKWQPKPTTTVTQSNNVTAADLVAQLSTSYDKCKAGENSVSVQVDDFYFDHVIGSAAEDESCG